jgi:hypothetical protein
MMKKKKSWSHLPLVFTVACMTMAGCVSYDSPELYKKNFQPGTHALLRFDGWYLQPSSQSGSVKPIFFYSNGSVYFAEAPFPASINALQMITQPHSWGNFRIDGDTILLERFYKAETSDNYNRILMKGIVERDNIHWIFREAHREDPEALNYDTKFEQHAVKPDSTKNWTRTYPPFNK